MGLYTLLLIVQANLIYFLSLFFWRAEIAEHSTDNPVMRPRWRAATICQPILDGADAEQWRHGLEAAADFLGDGLETTRNYYATPLSASAPLSAKVVDWTA
jgi:hypothetical protein